MRTRALVATIAIATLVPLAMPDDAKAQRRTSGEGFEPAENVFQPRAARKQFRAPGTAAWSVAKRYGFEFYPERSGMNGVRITRPRDGVETRLENDAPGFITAPPVWAIVQAGNMVAKGGRHTNPITFHMFAKRKLAPGWEIEEIRLGGTYTWKRQPREGTDDPSFKVILSGRRTGDTQAIIREVVLEGPATASSWEEAFEVGP